MKFTAMRDSDILCTDFPLPCREGDRGWAPRRQYQIETPIKIAHHLIVRQPEDAEATGGEDDIALGVVGGLGGVDRAVDLDDEARVVAVEIDDKAVDHLLAAELPPAQLVRA
jgi:hypothetical protein